MTDPADSHWEWMIPFYGTRLHYIADPATRTAYDNTGTAQWDRAICGRSSRWSIPGVFNRLGAPRCTLCCRALGIPQGDGTPANEKAHNDKANG